MMKTSMLYPIDNQYRTRMRLDGMWKFKFDPQDSGVENQWTHGLTDTMDMPVPSSFNDYFTDKESRDYTGTFWYQPEVFIEDRPNEAIILRFASATHEADVYVNGSHVGHHRGGFLPFELAINKAVKPNQLNTVVVKMNNLLSKTTLPAGQTKQLKDGRIITEPYFDFFNYAGLQRSVDLLYVPNIRVVDFETRFEIEKNQAQVHYSVYTNQVAGVDRVKVSLRDKENRVVAESEGKSGTLTVKNPHLWQVRDSYLYDLTIHLSDHASVVDEYTQAIGIRTVEIENTDILINGEPVYLKGYGKHEEVDIIGRGFSQATMKRDFELMKWSGANSFRTAHYPYAEEVYQMADREGFLIIDEVAAVGFLESIANFLTAATGTEKRFFDDHPDLATLQEHHLDDIQALIQRDKNHPSVFAWSLLNEPDTETETAKEYFAPIFEKAHEWDPQQRPRTFALVMTSTPETCQCYKYSDFISLNRYYGWYVDGGSSITDAEAAFKKEMDQWKALNLNVPFVFTEYGADTYNGETKLPSVMWTEQYQAEYFEMQHRIFDQYDFVVGEQLWNFADFQTVEGIMRVNGNKKGVFTRQRQPKRIAYQIRERWMKN